MGFKLSKKHFLTSDGSMHIAGIVFSSFLLCIITSGLLNTNVFATDSTLTISIDDNVLDLDILPNSPNGDFAKSDNSTISVTTDNASGYTLSITASNSTSLSGDNGSIVTIDTAVSENDFSANTAEAGSNYNGKWGYLPSKLNSTNNTNFRPSPGTGNNAHTLDVTSTANSTANTYTLAIGARVDSSLPAGSYSNTFVITAVANGTPYTLTYNKNAGSDTVSNMPTNVTNGVSYASTINLGTTTPTRTGYAFAGWCTSSASQTSCSSTLYNSTNGNLASFPIDRTASTNNVTVYAIWTPNNYTCTKRYRLQNADGSWGSYQSDGTQQVAYGSTCSYSKSVTDYKNSASGTNNAQASTSGTMNSTSGITLSLSFYRNTYALTVNRNTTYISSASATTSAVHGSNYYRWGQIIDITATALSSGEFSAWSQTSGTTSTFGSTSSATTTFTMPKSAATIYANGVANFCASHTCMQNLSSSSCTTTASTVYDGRDEQSYKIKKLNDNKCWMITNLNLGSTTLTRDLTSANTNLDATITAATFNSWKKTSGSNSNTSGEFIPISGNDSTNSSPYGTLYNYYVTSAGTINKNSSSVNATYDICPAGWRLPTSAEFSTLIGTTAYNTLAKIRRSTTASMTLAGYFLSGTPAGQGSNGTYWSSTYSNSIMMYGLYLSTNNSMLQVDEDLRGAGNSVRCVLK